MFMWVPITLLQLFGIIRVSNPTPQTSTYNVRKQLEVKQQKLKWEKLGGKKKVCMRMHQYEIEHLERIVTLGACPLARGALASTARTISYVAPLGRF